MLRLTFVSFLIVIGAYFTLRSPFYGVLFYLGNAYFRPEEWVHTDLIRSLNLSYLIGCYVVISSVFSKAKFVCNGRVLLMLLFLLHAILSTAMSQYAFYSWPFLVEFIKVVLITYFIVIFVTDFWKFRLVIIVMVLALGLEQSKQGWFYLLTSPGGANMNPVAFLGDNNGTALGMLMLVPMSAFLFQTSKEKMTKVACAGILVGCLYRALSTYSRGGFLAAIAMAVAWWLQSFHKLRFVFGLVVILLIVVPVLPSAFWDRQSTIQTYDKDEDASALGRFHFWQVALKMAEANPVFGVGFNSYNTAYDSFDVSDGAFGRGRSVHSTLFGVVAELGYPGLFLYLAILGCSFKTCSQVRKLGFQSVIPIELGKAAVALQISFVAFVTAGTFVPGQYGEMVWHFFGLTVALRQIALRSLEQQAAQSQQQKALVA